ncbi:MAG: acetylornithine/N-succinyldiaminopimelate aminotransferase [Actinomycetota bacterium]|jgi:acetylornithine aminotransferase|nr:acetylornithine/N-succinyldiaminopimelate aminotransferase [Actinomycetota bacterium]
MTDYMMQTYRRLPVEFVSGSGARLVDSNGREYVDMLAGIAVASVGHAHPAVAEAIADQASRLIHVSNIYSTGPQQELAERLAALSGGMRSFFCNSGAEAVECALKLARRWSGKTKEGSATGIISTNGGFHGRTYGALAATGQPAKQAPFAPLPGGFVHVPFGDHHALSEAMTEKVAAVILEPIQGENGVVVPPEGYFGFVRRMCDSFEALLILDEVQTGIARTGRWFAHEHLRITPDIMCLAKGLGGGLPIGACLATPEVAEAFEPGDHGSTFGGGPVQCAAALAVLRVIEDEGLLERAHYLGERLQKELEHIFGDAAEVRGAGLMIGIEFREPVAQAICERALAHGVLVNNATDRVVRLTPPLVITDEDIEKALTELEEVWDEVRAA